MAVPSQGFLTVGLHETHRRLKQNPPFAKFVKMMFEAPSWREAPHWFSAVFGDSVLAESAVPGLDPGHATW